MLYIIKNEVQEYINISNEITLLRMEAHKFDNLLLANEWVILVNKKHKPRNKFQVYVGEFD